MIRYQNIYHMLAYAFQVLDEQGYRDVALEEDFENKFPVHKTSFTITGKDAPDSDVDHNTGNVVSNPSTESTVSNNGNASPSPSDT